MMFKDGKCKCIYLICQAYMIVKFDRTMVFKEENISPLSYSDVEFRYQGEDGDPFADATIRKLLIRSFDF